MSEMGGTNIHEGDRQPAKDGPPIIVVDMDKRQSRKKVKRLRKGKGSLMDEVIKMIQELRDKGTLASGVQPVVIIVREKARGTRIGMGLL
jgi:hypothetical protein